MLSLTTMALALVAGTAVTTAGNASAAGTTHVVEAGESIQAAIDAAQPGDTIKVEPGVYTEALVITTDDLTLKGSHGTVLTMPETADNACTEFLDGLVVGICVFGGIDFETFEVTDPVENPRISGFVVRGFSESGILALATEGLRVTDTKARNNGGYGIFSLASTRPVLAHNKASGNGFAGLYVGSNQDVDAKVYDNVSRNNAIGIFLRDVSDGVVKRNETIGNCAGILLLANAPGPVTEWKIRHNLVKRNNKSDCGGEEGVPSGNGILLMGASDNKVTENIVLGNRGEGPEGGGIALVIAEPEEEGGEAIVPSGNTIRHNLVLRSRPFDLFSDGTGEGNRFRHNLCMTSEPANLCG